MSFGDIFQNLISGISIGCTYGIIGLGVVFLWQSIERINFANISSAMLSAYLFYSCYTSLQLGFWGAFILSIAAVAVYGLLLRHLIYEPIARSGGGKLEFVVATLMLSILWLTVIISTYGGLPKAFPPVFGTASDLLTIGDIRLPRYYLYIFSVVFTLMIFLHLFLHKSLIGKIMRACAQNATAAQLMGINVNRITSLAFMLATSVVGIGGILLAPVYFVSLELGGGTIGVKGFAAAVMGGLMDPYGTLLGGVVIGILENFSTLFISSTYKDVISFTVLIAVLIGNPNGIFNWSGKRS